MIAVASVGYDHGEYQFISLVRVTDGAVEPLGTLKWFDVGRVGWLADGSGIVAGCNSEVNSVATQYYLFSYPEGEPRKITNDLNDYRDLGLTANSATLATVQEERTMNVWVAPGGEASKLRQLRNGAEKYEGNTGIQWTPDGRIVFDSEPNGVSNIWIMNGDGTGLKQLTRVSGRDHNESPAVSPDGRYIVLISYRGEIGLWRMNIDGGNPTQLTEVGGGSVHKYSSPLSYMDMKGGVSNIWAQPIDGGQSRQLTNLTSGEIFWSDLSRDGRPSLFSGGEVKKCGVD